MTVKITKPQINLREELSTALTLEGLKNQTLQVKNFVSDGNVGIGTSDPQRRLTVQQNSTSSLTTMALYNADTTNNNASIISFRTDTVGTGASSFVEMGGIKVSYEEHDHTTRNGSLSFFTSDGSISEKMRIAGNGNVGIGTSSPATLLDVKTAGTNGDNPVAEFRAGINNNETYGTVTIGAQGSSRGIKLKGGRGTAVGKGVISVLDVSEAEKDVVTFDEDGDIITFLTNSSEAMRIDSSGNIGIGTSTPARPLHVDGSAYISGNIYAGDSNSATSYSGGLTLSNEVQASSTTEGAAVGHTLRVSEGSNNRRAVFFLDDTNGVYGLQGTASTGVPDFVIQTGSAERLRIDSSGNVGIGTSSPSELLEVSSTDASTAIEVTAGQQSVTTGESKIVLRALNAGSGVTYPTSEVASLSTGPGDTNLIFRTTTDSSGAQEAMRIDQSGQVGVGTSSPGEKLDIQDGSVRTKISLGTTEDHHTFANNGGTRYGGVGLFTGSADLYIEDDTGDRITFDRTANVIKFVTNSGESARIDSSGRVGIGTSSPGAELEVAEASSPRISINDTAGGATNMNAGIQLTYGANVSAFMGYNANSADMGIENRINGALFFETNNTERMRIDSSGNLLVGQTDIGDYIDTPGSSFRANGFNSHTRDGNATLVLNRLTSDGEIIQFRKDGTTEGSIGISGQYTYIRGGAAGLIYRDSDVLPTNSAGSLNDNAIDLGDPSVRFDDVYATNGTIQTSDQNEKQDIAELDEAEKRVAVAAKGLIRKYRWKDAVEKKGDDARIHVGIIAQDLQAAFEAEGLDAGRYAMFIRSTWWEAEETYTDDDGVEQTRTVTYDTAEEAPEGAVEKTRMGVRYPELLAFIIGAM